MSYFADKVIQFNRTLKYTGKLPKDTRVLNPFQENRAILSLSQQFYVKFYNDNRPRTLILGINPGRLGAGATGIPFTDTKRLTEVCGISVPDLHTHEPSSVFVYDVIEKYGGCAKFYSHFYINSVCPLGFIKKNSKGNWVNYNYYDDMELYNSAKVFMVSSLKKQIAMGVDPNVCYVLGKKNAKFLSCINKEEKLFGQLVVLDHPRYIMQYKMKQKESYLQEYLRAFDRA